MAAERFAMLAHLHSMDEPFVPVLEELTAIQADAIRATAAAHDRNPAELALELMHLLIIEETAEVIKDSPVTPALTADHDDTVRILLPLEDSSDQ